MDLFAGAVNRENPGGILWVCDRCFKYMADGTSWEVHMVRHSPRLARLMSINWFRVNAEEVHP
jgi:hypothetical protein